MSLKTWKDEFLGEEYPSDPLEALDHSIKKWEGLSRENLDKHHLIVYNGKIIEKNNSENSERINSSNCALCVHYLGVGIFQCISCPIYQITLRKCDGEYRVFVDNGNNEPMLFLLLDVRAKWAAKMAVGGGPLGLTGTVDQGSERPESRPAGERPSEGLPGADRAV